MCARVCVRASWDVVDETRAKEARPKGGREDVREAQAGAGMWTRVMARMTALGDARERWLVRTHQLLAGYCSCRVHTVGMDWGVRVQPSLAPMRV